MEITFEKVNNEYIAEFEITTYSNLHIEKKCASSTKLYQRTNGGGWDLVDEAKNMQGAVDDFDLSALVYPKFIKVVCNAEPLYAEVTTSGEITEIKAQSKEIEVTSNGTINVTPDAGFAYLNSVKVNTNVPTSGEGGGSASGESDITYLKAASGSQDELLMAMEFADIFHLNGEVLPIVVASQQDTTIFKGCASIKGLTMSGINRDEMIADVVSQGHFTEITKEEFYTL